MSDARERLYEVLKEIFDPTQAQAVAESILDQHAFAQAQRIRIELITNNVQPEEQRVVMKYADLIDPLEKS